MRRQFFLLLFVILLSATWVAMADEEFPNAIPITEPHQSGQMILSHPPEIPVTLEPIDGPEAFALANHGADSCDVAPFLDFPEGIVVSDQTTVTSFTQNDLTDPSLSCMVGTPTDPRGYRTTWFQMTAPIDGTLVVETKTNTNYRRNYDTVIAIHSGTCAAPTQIACNDDSYAILSRATAVISEGNTYLIEVVDRNIATSGAAILNLEAYIVPAAQWRTVGTLVDSLSRHAVVISGTQAFIIAGQTELGANPERTGDVYRFDWPARTLTPRAPMPAGASLNGQGYSNTDAAIVEDKIHMPAGFVGADGSYDGTHWVYNIPNNSWQVYSAVNGQKDPPWANPGIDAPGWIELIPFVEGAERGFYVAGGLTGSFLPADPADAEPSRKFYRYAESDTNMIWQERAEMNTARYAHTGANINGLICVVGGLSTLGGPPADTNVLQADGECYDPATQSWSIIGALNVPRYMADSAVAPDGRWLVFGGIDVNGNHVEKIEYYDFQAAQWVVLSSDNDLDKPALAWPRGGFFGNDLCIFGGEQFGGPVPVSLIQCLPVPFTTADTFPFRNYLPSVPFSDLEPGEAFISAFVMQFGESRTGNFSGGVGDVYDIYAFDVTEVGTVTTSVTNIPFGSNYDLIIYDQNKAIVPPVGQNLSNVFEMVTITISNASQFGRYYAVVVRDAPPPSLPPNPAPYTITVTSP